MTGMDLLIAMGDIKDEYIDEAAITPEKPQQDFGPATAPEESGSADRSSGRRGFKLYRYQQIMAVAAAVAAVLISFGAYRLLSNNSATMGDATYESAPADGGAAADSAPAEWAETEAASESAESMAEEESMPQEYGESARGAYEDESADETDQPEAFFRKDKTPLRGEEDAESSAETYEGTAEDDEMHKLMPENTQDTADAAAEADNAYSSAYEDIELAKADEKDVEALLGRGFDLPQGTLDITYFTAEEKNLAQASFEYEGYEFTARLMKAEEYEDISGTGPGWMIGKALSGRGEFCSRTGADGRETLYLLYLEDEGLMYSLYSPGDVPESVVKKLVIKSGTGKR